MDGVHRIEKATAKVQTHIPALRFIQTPAHDFLKVPLNDLPYLDEVE